MKFNKEFWDPFCSLTNEDIIKANICLVSVFSNILKRSFIFCKICNPKGESYYTQKKFNETGKEAIYFQK